MLKVVGVVTGARTSAEPTLVIDGVRRLLWKHFTVTASHSGRDCTVSYVDEIEDLRHLNDHLNAEIVDKISEWVEVSKRLAEINRVHGRSPEALREELLANVRRAALKHGLDPKGLERIFAEIMEVRDGPEVGSS